MTSSAEILLPYALEPEDVSTITHPQPTSTPTHPPLPLLEPPGGCMGLKHGEVYSRKGACPDKTSGPFNGRPRPGIRPPLLGPRRALQHRHTNISSGRPKWKTQTRNIEISSGRGEGERWDSRKKRRGGSLVSQTCWKTLCADEGQTCSCVLQMCHERASVPTAMLPMLTLLQKVHFASATVRRVLSQISKTWKRKNFTQTKERDRWTEGKGERGSELQRSTAQLLHMTPRLISWLNPGGFSWQLGPSSILRLLLHSLTSAVRVPQPAQPPWQSWRRVQLSSL